MNVLIVYAHPEPRSFNAALVQAAATHFREAGHDVAISDLYADAFDPVAGPGDYVERARTDRYEYRTEMKNALSGAGYVPQIANEQRKLKWCDLLVLQFPMWWFGPPAILKGWFDRVMTYGFAYTPAERFELGLLRGRRAVASITTGAHANVFAPDGMDGDIHRLLWPIQNGVLRYVGFDVVPPIISYGIGQIDEAGRADVLRAFHDRLRALPFEQPLFFHPLADYGPDRRLRPGVVAKTSFQWNPEVEQFP